MKNLVTESDFVETYDDFLSESTCSQLISLVDEENERIEIYQNQNNMVKHPAQQILDG